VGGENRRRESTFTGMGFGIPRIVFIIMVPAAGSIKTGSLFQLTDSAPFKLFHLWLIYSNVMFSIGFGLYRSNCDAATSHILRNHYERPYFLPTTAESTHADWIFMGTPDGPGAHMHVSTRRVRFLHIPCSIIKIWTGTSPGSFGDSDFIPAINIILMITGPT